MLKNISNLISMFAFNEFHKYEYSLVKTTINELINTNDRDLLIIDKDGIINHCSSNIQHLFSFAIYTLTPSSKYSQKILLIGY